MDQENKNGLERLSGRKEGRKEGKGEADNLIEVADVAANLSADAKRAAVAALEAMLASDDASVKEAAAFFLDNLDEYQA